MQEDGGRLVESLRLRCEAAVYQMVGGLGPGDAIIQLHTGAVLTFSGVRCMAVDPDPVGSETRYLFTGSGS